MDWRKVIPDLRLYKSTEARVQGPILRMLMNGDRPQSVLHHECKFKLD